MNIRIAVIDSGVNPQHSHVQKIKGGITLSLNEEGQIVQWNDFKDNIGHGTALTGIIRYKAPFADIFAVKIFDRSLNAQAELLFASMKWALKQEMNIIHLSLGTERNQDKNVLQEISNNAIDKNCIIVGAARSPYDQIYPSSLDNVIGVYWNKKCEEDDIVYHPENPIEFGAYGWPRDLPGQPREMNFRGSSFAAGYVSAYIAQIVQISPKYDFFFVKRKLLEIATKEIL